MQMGMNNDKDTISKSVKYNPCLREKFKDFINSQTGYRVEYSNDGISINDIINSITLLNKNEESEE